MDSGATKHMSLHTMAFDTYKVIFPRNVHLDDISVAKAMEWGPLLSELKREQNV